MGILEGILAIGAIIVFFVKFIKGILVKYVGFAIILSSQFVITASLISFVVIFYAFTITALVSIYNKGTEIFIYATTADNGMLSCLFGFLDCIGVASALQNGLSMAYGALSIVVIFHLMKFTFSAMKIIGNELFKLGLLLGQALS